MRLLLMLRCQAPSGRVARCAQVQLIVQLEVGELLLMDGKAIYELRCMVRASFFYLKLHLSLSDCKQLPGCLICAMARYADAAAAVNLFDVHAKRRA